MEIIMAINENQNSRLREKAFGILPFQIFYKCVFKFKQIFLNRKFRQFLPFYSKQQALERIVEVSSRAQRSVIIVSL